MRSKLFVPGSRPELFAKAEASAADALSFDLEDAVAAARKEEARGLLSDYLRTRKGGKPVVVRVNALGTSPGLKPMSPPSPQRVPTSSTCLHGP